MADSSSRPPSDESDTERTHAAARQRAAKRKRKIRFAQVRSVGILLTLVSLLGLVLYNTFAEGNPWSSRAEDVRLLMTLLSVLLGVDVILGNRAAMVRLVGESLQVAGRAVLVYLKTEYDTETAQASESDADDADADADEREDDHV